MDHLWSGGWGFQSCCWREWMWERRNTKNTSLHPSIDRWKDKLDCWVETITAQTSSDVISGHLDSTDSDLEVLQFELLLVQLQLLPSNLLLDAMSFLQWNSDIGHLHSSVWRWTSVGQQSESLQWWLAASPSSGQTPPSSSCEPKHAKIDRREKLVFFLMSYIDFLIYRDPIFQY